MDLLTYRSVAMSHAQGLGLFEQVLGHEPVSAPGSGLIYALWLARIGPVATGSGLSLASGRIELTGRVFMPADTEPQDDVDTAVAGAVDALMTAYAGDFEFGGAVRNVDILGAHGTPLSAQFGYARFDSTTYRVATLAVPLIVNDLWEEVA
ncbi:hypothetical protein [Streptomyces uncialis]|uniref:hypothetical protein n=1 Tax=Streptomyces uncialis TaxID=1048205 RepID=UPI0037B654E4